MKRLLIEFRDDYMWLALADEGRLCEIFREKLTEGLSGSWVDRVIVGRVRNIMHGRMAFVDIGMNRDAFMSLPEAHNLRAGQSVLVQVQKDAIAPKGAKVDTTLHLRGRLAVITRKQTSRGAVGVSKKISDIAERTRLRKAARPLPADYDVIIRTNAVGQTAEDIKAEIATLVHLHEELENRAEFAMPPITLHPQKGAAMPILADLLSDDIDEIYVSDPNRCDEIRKAVYAISPALASRVQPHGEEERTLFDAYSVNQQIAAALNKRVQLPSGGHVTFEETEACVVIDVNSGRTSGKHALRDALLAINLEAAACIAAGLKLRNLSGTIIVDFINMQSRADQQIILDALETAIKKDRVKVEIIQTTQLQLVILTRQKTRASLSGLLQQTCSHCGGTGRV